MFAGLYLRNSGRTTSITVDVARLVTILREVGKFLHAVILLIGGVIVLGETLLLLLVSINAVVWLGDQPRRSPQWWLVFISVPLAAGGIVVFRIANERIRKIIDHPQEKGE